MDNKKNKNFMSIEDTDGEWIYCNELGGHCEVENDCRVCPYGLDHEYEDDTYFDGMTVSPMPKPIVVKPVFGKEFVYTSSPWALARNTRKEPSTFIMQDVVERIKEWVKENGDVSEMENIKLDGLIHDDEVAKIIDDKIYAVREPEIRPHGCSEYGAVTGDLDNYFDDISKYRLVGLTANKATKLFGEPKRVNDPIDAWKE